MSQRIDEIVKTQRHEYECQSENEAGAECTCQLKELKSTLESFATEIRETERERIRKIIEELSQPQTEEGEDK